MDSTQAKMFADQLQGTTIGGWLIDGSLGNGKSAVVLSASRDGQRGAVKVFHPELVERYGKAAQLERILRERSLIGAEHPNLVRILDGGECGSTGHLYVVMEELPYSNLHDALSQIPPSAIGRILSQIASAARFLEDRGLAHRDIKPENIAVSPDFQHVKLLDLGVLLPIGLSDLTDVDQRPFIGTLRYSSPEFLLREEADTTEGWRAVTFYQLGGVLHDMLMKRPLFADYSEPFSQLVHAVEEVIPEIHFPDARLVTLANHCLVKKPDTRIKLVNWSNFSGEVSQGASQASALLDRIKSRQVYSRASTEQPASAAADERANIKRALNDLTNRLESRVAQIMNNLQCFPLRATKSLTDLSCNTVVTIVHFEVDEEKGISYRLSVVLSVNLVDYNGGAPIYKASIGAALSADVPPSAQAVSLKEFASGGAEEILDGPILEQQFINALEACYESQERGDFPQNEKFLILSWG
ncbi:serine/threonine-protein kinase [Ralstonia pseudosolanacearum]